MIQGTFISLRTRKPDCFIPLTNTNAPALSERKSSEQILRPTACPELLSTRDTVNILPRHCAGLAFIHREKNSSQLAAEETAPPGTNYFILRGT